MTGSPFQKALFPGGVPHPERCPTLAARFWRQGGSHSIGSLGRCPVQGPAAAL